MKKTSDRLFENTKIILGLMEFGVEGVIMFDFYEKEGFVLLMSVGLKIRRRFVFILK